MRYDIMFAKDLNGKDCNSVFAYSMEDINAAYWEMAKSMKYYLSLPSYNKIELAVRAVSKDNK